MSIASPYRPEYGAAPPLAFEDVALIGEITADCRTLAETGTNPGRPYLLNGPDGVGKTFILERLYNYYLSGWMRLRLSLGRGNADMGESLVEGLLGLRDEAETAEERQQRWMREAELGTTLMERPRSTLEHVANVVDDVARAAWASSGGRTGLVLLIDDLEWGNSTDIELLTEACHRARYCPAVAVITTTDAAALATHSAPLLEQFAWRTVSPLPAEVIDRLVTEPARNLGVEWTHEAIALLVHESNGNAFAVQFYADQAWRAANPTGDSTITVDHVLAAVSAAARLRDPQ